MADKIFFAIPTKSGLNPYTHSSFSYNMWELGKSGIDIMESRMYDHYPLSEARNAAVKEFLESDCSHLFMWDDDMLFYKGTMLRLIKADRPVVSGWYIARHGTGSLIVFKRMPGKKIMDLTDFSFYKPYTIREFTLLPSEETPSGKILRVDGVGAGCLLIRRDVFDKVKYPYFAEWSPLVAPQDSHHFGEDLYFCEKLNSLGIPLYVHSLCFVGHCAKQVYVVDHRELQRKALEEGLTTPDKLFKFS